MKSMVALVVVVGMTMAGCSDGNNEKTESASGEGVRPLVSTTSYPLTYFVERIAGAVVDVRFAASGEEDPAFWKPGSDDVLAMQKADLIVLNGASYEAWLDIVSLPPSRMVITTDDLRDRLIPVKKEASHSHGLKGEHEHFGTAFTTWLDPTLAAAQASAIERALVARWPQHASLFEAQLASLAHELAELDAEAQKAVAGNTDQPVLFSHPVYQYLTHRYQLNSRSVHWEPGQMPDEAAWQELGATLEDFPAAWMIWEGQPLPEVSERLESIGIRCVLIDPCATPPESGDFLSVMAENLESLQAVFGAR